MHTQEIIVTLAERFGLLVGGAFLLLTFAPVKRIGFSPMQTRQKTLFLIIFFGVFGIIGTYTGNLVFQSVANLRAMAVVTGGLFGGPVVGLGAGLIAGAHRVLTDLNGFSAWPCGISTALEGLVAGLISYKMGNRALNWMVAAPLTFAGETIHMVLVLTLSRNYIDAVELVKLIAAPMIIINTLGSALFVEIINMFIQDRDRRESLHAQQILDIANHTVSYLRSGLTLESAQATAEIIHKRVGVAAVAVTDTRTVLAHVGEGSDHHLVSHDVRTRATKEVLRTGEAVFITSASRIGCDHQGCPLDSATIVPLKKNSTVVGSLKFYGSEYAPLNRTMFELTKGLGNLFSTQLELEDIQVKEQLLARAEIRRLQTQINPHFLFNSLNTIASFCRTNAEKARELLLDLSLYMRKNLDSSQNFVPLQHELEQINSYLAIEQARFGDRIKVSMDIDSSCRDVPIPPLLIQPLVENSIRHGISGLEGGGCVELSASRNNGHLSISVVDDGVGMDKKTLHNILSRHHMEGTRQGIGVKNCANRLEQIYGPGYSLHIISEPGQGTNISFQIPTHPENHSQIPNTAISD
ncbi:MAG: LytS/YhcK type 5TM receptor domain-containing protein [Desulfovibrio sp.]|uniref:LytS/YhcK type 5TM receptor domain-containing protein n=1 Tax=Desulfovibrio sp. 7SRBS1 TaxID=3378064 RepID=UPI003B3D1154